MKRVRWTFRHNDARVRTWCGLKDLYQDKDYWLTMYGYANYGATYKQTLGLGDINGLRAVYGA